MFGISWHFCHKSVLLSLFLLFSTAIAQAGGQHGMPIERLEEEMVRIEKVAWQVALINNSNSMLLCGGSILSPNFILTAAHCTDRIESPINLSIRYGSVLWTDTDKSISVEKITRHPLYDSITFDNDIAVVKLSSALAFSGSHNSVRLSTKPPSPDRPGLITGWGESNQLDAVQTILTNLTACNDAYADVGLTISDRMFCAAKFPPEEMDIESVDICDGDEGSAITWDQLQIGVSSWGFGCRLPQSEFFDVYARVDVAREFIDELTDFEAVWV